MEELSIEEKARRYDEVINRMKYYVVDEYGCSRIKVADVFPELKESEDERIRKSLIELFKDMEWDDSILHDYNMDKDKTIAWLEKQGEQKPTDKIQLGKEYKCIASPRYSTFSIDKIYKPEDKFLCRFMNLCSDCFEPIEDSERNDLASNTNKVEPKFEVGDWVVRTNGERFCNGSKFAQIQSIQVDGEMCYLDTGRWLYTSEIRLWTIEDAEDGDVLYYKTKSGTKYILMNKGLNEHDNINSYFRYNSLDGFGADIPAVLSARQDGIMPATKEQRDFLFQKMREAGYEWNSETKELNKDNENKESNS